MYVLLNVVYDQDKQEKENKVPFVFLPPPPDRHCPPLVSYVPNLTWHPLKFDIFSENQDILKGRLLEDYFG